MPYIALYRRNEFDKIIASADIIENVGDLNYLVTRIATRLIDRLGMTYTNISLVMGTLYMIPAEMYRRMVAPYEDKKIEENGDIREYESCKSL